MGVSATERVTDTRLRQVFDGRRRLVNVYSATRSGMAELLEIRNLDKQIKSLQNQVKKDKGRDADLNRNLFDKLAERGRRKRAYDKNKNIWVECPDKRRRLVNVYSATRSGMAELLEIRNLDKQIKSLQNQGKKDKGRD